MTDPTVSEVEGPYAQQNRDTFAAAVRQGMESVTPASFTEGCDHPSSEGVDQTPVGDPSKVWRCCVCGEELSA